MKLSIELSEQEISIITNALNTYWNDAQEQLDNKGRYNHTGKIPLGHIEEKLLEQRKELTMPILRRFENLI